MPDESPRMPNAKKPGKSLKEKRESKKIENAKTRVAGGWRAVRVQVPAGAASDLGSGRCR